MTQKQIKQKLKELKRLSAEYLKLSTRSTALALKADKLKSAALKVYKSIPEDDRLMHKDEIRKALDKILTDF